MLFFLGERGLGVPPPKFFLQFLYLWKVLIKNPDDAKLASLGKLSNMQIRAAITEISFLGHISIIIQDKWKIVVSTPRFSWSMILIRPLPRGPLWGFQIHVHPLYCWTNMISHWHDPWTVSQILWPPNHICTMRDGFSPAKLGLNPRAVYWKNLAEILHITFWWRPPPSPLGELKMWSCSVDGASLWQPLLGSPIFSCFVSFLHSISSGMAELVWLKLCIETKLFCSDILRAGVCHAACITVKCAVIKIKTVKCSLILANS